MRREGDSVPDSAERCKKQKAEDIDLVSCKKLPGEEKEEKDSPRALADIFLLGGQWTRGRRG